ncbi:MAG: hypothetical protein K1W40_19930 [Schaedlerella sp.]|uniref:hypothetical protein n=1 Tax=Schaedlerella sp. TaxID=2676057 RepID=UPI00265D62B9|nr:hypothetical protein [uncultured Schaedlerella sp.]
MPEIELLAGWSARRFRQSHGFIGPDAVQQRRSFIGLDTVAADPIILIAVSIGCEHILL